MARALPVQRLVLAWAALVALLAVSAAAVFLPLSPWKPAIGLGIAALKIAIIAAVFMHVRALGGITRVFALSGLLWLSILLGLVALDQLTRGPAMGGSPAAGAGADAP